MVKNMKRKAGQGMTEYVIIICIVAIAALLVIGVFGTNIKNLFHTANKSLSTGKAEDAAQSDDGDTTAVKINKFSK